jgi:hypothetical protein
MNQIYYGLASCHGLDSFLLTQDVNASTSLGKELGDMIYGKEENDKRSKDLNSKINGMIMSAQANAHRRVVVYRAKLNPEMAEIIQDLMKKGKHVKALKLLKETALEIGLAPGVPMAKKFWSEIPNPKLDPFN